MLWRLVVSMGGSVRGLLRCRQGMRLGRVSMHLSIDVLVGGGEGSHVRVLGIILVFVVVCEGVGYLQR